MGRAGSTSIQQFLWSNRNVLPAHGWHYPEQTAFGFQPDSNAIGNLTALAQLSKRRGTASRPIDCSAQLEAFSEYLAGAGTGNVVLSSEWAGSRHRSFFHDLLAASRKHNYRAQILIYFREQRGWLLSAYAQRVKRLRWTLSAEEYLRAVQISDLDYHATLLKFTQIFGKEDVIARIYDRARLVEGDIQKDLLEAMGLQAVKFKLADPNANVSADLVEIELLRLVNQYCRGAQIDNRQLLRLSAQIDYPRDRRLYRLVPPALLLSLKEAFRASNDRLAAELGYASSADLFVNDIPESYPVLDERDRVSEHSVRILSAYICKIHESESA